MHTTARRLALKAALAAGTAAALSGCGGGGGSGTGAAPPSTERQLSPATVDPRVSTATEDHVAINPDPFLTPAGRLFVFLPGTDGTPAMYRRILQAGAARGYHTIGLNYPNPTPVGLLCRVSLDNECYWDVRREIVTGNDESDRVDIRRPDAIDTRLAMALAYLDNAHPNEGWGQYVSAGSLAWSRIIVAGHSQGGGHAGIIAKLRSVYRAVYFAAPADWDGLADGPANWLTRSGQTPASRQYGFSHLRDPLVPHEDVVRIWAALGMNAFGGVLSVDGRAAPYDDRHMLSTDAEPGSGLAASPYHGGPVLDAVTPIASDGTPLYTPVWNHLCFP